MTSECEKTCEICGEIFSKQGSLNTHIMTVHPDVKAFKCRLCLVEFDTRSEIMEHIVNLHGEEEVEENIETRQGDVYYILPLPSLHIVFSAWGKTLIIRGK